MNRIKTFFKKYAVVSLLLAASACQAAAQPAARTILETVDRYSDFRRRDFYTHFEMIRKSPDTGTTVLEIEMFRKDKNDKFLIFFLAPRTEFGKGYLSIGDVLWFYNPTTRELIRKTKKEAIGGSDAHSRDFEKSDFLKDWTARVEKGEKVGTIDCWKVVMEAKIRDVAYPVAHLWVRKDNFLPVKRMEYTYSQRLAQVLYYLSYVKSGENYFASKMLIINKLEPGKRTVLTLKHFSTKPIDDSFFTRAYLEKRSR